jgi:hypothetical protein
MEGASKKLNEKPVTEGDVVVLCLWGQFLKCTVEGVKSGPESTVCVKLPWNNTLCYCPTSSCKLVSIAIAYCVSANYAQDSAIFGSAIKLLQTTHKHLLDPSYDGRISYESCKCLKQQVYKFYHNAVFPALLQAQLDQRNRAGPWDGFGGLLGGYPPVGEGPNTCSIHPAAIPTNPDYTGLVPAKFLPPNKFVSVPPYDVWLEMREGGYSGMEIMSYQKEVDLVGAMLWDAWNKNTRGPCCGTGQYHSFVGIEHTIVNIISTNRLSTYANLAIEPLRDNSVDFPKVAEQLLKTVRVVKLPESPWVHVMGGDAFKEGLVCYLCEKKSRGRENQVHFFLDIQIPPNNKIVRVSRCQSCMNLCIILRESLAVDLNGPRNENSTDDSDYFVMQVAIKLQEYARISF